jgi:hypothetical protein
VVAGPFVSGADSPWAHERANENAALAAKCKKAALRMGGALLGKGRSCSPFGSGRCSIR